MCDNSKRYFWEFICNGQKEQVTYTAWGISNSIDASMTMTFVIVPYELPKDATGFVGEGLTGAREWSPMDATRG